MENTLPPAASSPSAHGFQWAWRWRAAAIHLALSALVAALAALLVFAAELQGYVAATGRSAEQLKYLPLLARRTDWVALVDGQSGEIVGHAPFDGF